MPLVYRIALVDGTDIVIESLSLFPPSEETVQQLAATAKRFDLGPVTNVAVAEDLACRGCGCTEDDACATAAGPCRWVEPDLCSACQAPRLILRG